MSASDEDADNNGAIRYSLAAPFQRDDLNYFDIQPESGWIFLRKPLDVSFFYSSWIFLSKPLYVSVLIQAGSFSVSRLT